jgi:hypothetical protein
MNPEDEPTTKELALLAALIHGEIGTSAKVEKAWDLWHASSSLLKRKSRERREGLERFIHYNAIEAGEKLLSKFKKPLSFPALFDQILRITMPGRKWEVLDKRFMKFLDSAEGKELRGTTSASAFYEANKGHHVPRERFLKIGAAWVMWLESDSKLVVSKKNSNAAKKRHEKKKKKVGAEETSEEKAEPQMAKSRRSTKRA